MKQILLIFLLSLVWPSENKSQIKVNVNIGNQPVWGPTGYDYARYYYLPDLDMYYDVNRREYVYNENNQWLYINHLPDRYRNYDLFKGYKVVFKEDRPFENHAVHFVKYKKFKNNHQQEAIIYSKDKKYHQIKDHPSNKHNNGTKKNKKN
ncbi:MAG: hypothetical protein CUR34_12470 [Sediminibacterium sp.]|nr:MAG: hypothetical protein CUR34_12470 [Sediminibacterium sp.] [Sediminibacterium sp. FEMGT703S]